LLREWRGETPQVQVCKLLDVDPATYCKFENGSRRPGGRWAARLEALTQGKVPSSSWYQPETSDAEAVLEAKAS
jgi:hypothetical protein